MPQPFPHLLPAEAIVWVAFLNQYGNRWDSFSYDVRVGKGHPIDPALPAFTQEMARRLNPKRIDAVGFVGSQPTIFQASPRCARTAFGAVLLYHDLWVEQFPDSVRPALAVVCALCDPDVQRIAPGRGITIYCVQAAVPVT